MSSQGVKVWHVRATRAAAEILGIPEADLTREIYQLFESEVYPIYRTEEYEIGEDLSRLVEAELDKEQT